MLFGCCLYFKHTRLIKRHTAHTQTEHKPEIEALVPNIGIGIIVYENKLNNIV